MRDDVCLPLLPADNIQAAKECVINARAGAAAFVDEEV